MTCIRRNRSRTHATSTTLSRNLSGHLPGGEGALCVWRFKLSCGVSFGVPSGCTLHVLLLTQSKQDSWAGRALPIAIPHICL